jgi:DnaJ-class molecular chaperone
MSNEPDPLCPRCGSDDMEWEECYVCDGEGEFDAYDDDPINYAPGEEYEMCRECSGNGGFLVCQSCISRAEQLEKKTGGGK